jgi:AcrR family transcriptional regulator
VTGLRDLKKERTRELIATTARSLFIERGFENVRIAEIARAAEVAEQTVFNYFPSKEDLVYWRLEVFEREMLTALEERSEGESIIKAFERFVTAQRGLLVRRDPEGREQLLAITRMISESPALLERERTIFERYTGSLAAAIAKANGRSGENIDAWVIANALMGVHRALIDFTRRRILAGDDTAKIQRAVQRQAARGFALLERGLDS